MRVIKGNKKSYSEISEINIENFVKAIHSK